MRCEWILIAALSLAGCALPSGNSVHTGEVRSDVRARLGEPTLERKIAKGDLAWYYATGPFGFETWRVVFESGGDRVAEYTQVLTAENFNALRKGATRDEALDLLGPPMERMSFARTGTEALTYRWLDGTLEMIADVVFDDASGALKSVALYRDPAYTDSNQN